MKSSLSLLASTSLLLVPACAVFAEKAPEPPVPVMSAPAQETRTVPPVENQRLYGPASPTIVPAEQAQALVAKFKEAYEKMGSPRILFYINRELVDTQSGLKLSGRTEKYQETKTEQKSILEQNASSPQPAPQTQINVSATGNAGPAAAVVQAPGKAESVGQTLTTSGENTYSLKEASKATLADRQTAREIERLFGRVFRAAGAALADQRLAADLLGDKPLGNLAGTNDQAAKDREALSKVAELAVEILVSSKSITTPTVSGDQPLSLPDIQVTAIRLKDAAIVGQAASSDILGKDRYAGRILQQYDVRDITEATALALMEDMLVGQK